MVQKKEKKNSKKKRKERKKERENPFAKREEEKISNKQIKAIVFPLTNLKYPS